jgi:transcriptional regulator with XRE-family HTH domain
MEKPMSLKAHRVDKGLTQKEVSKMMGMARNTLINYENFITIPDIETALKFAELYETTVDNIRWSKE